MEAQGCPLDLRGQNIFYLGRKNAASSPAPFPTNLFPLDPTMFSGALGLRRAEGSADVFLVAISNASPVAWLATGTRRVRLSVAEVDQDGRVVPDVRGFDLPCDLQPGQSTEIAIRAIKGEGVRGRWHQIGLFVEGAGPFEGTGRTKTVSLFAEALLPVNDPRRD